MFQASSSKRGESRDELVNDKDKLLRGGATPGDGRTQEDQGQLVHLTGARSLLSLWILADHFAHRASVFTDRANVAVNSFIMMSGFVTQWAYGSRDLSRCGPVAQFLVRRLGRVALTTYVAMLGASALLTFTATFPSTRHLVYCLLFVEPWMDPEDWCPDGQSWTIAALMPSWILFPVTKRVLSSIERLYGVRGLLWTFFLLWCVSLGPSLMIFGLQGHITNVQHNLAYVWPPSQVPDFMLGMIAAMLARHEAPSWQVNQGLVLSDWERGFLADVALIGVFAAVLLIPSSGYHEGWEPLFNHALAPLLGIYFYGSAAAKGAGLSACLLTLPPLAQLGKYSFEVFLFQQPLFSAFEVLWIGGLNEILPKWVLAVAFMVTLYLLSGLYAELIEAPFVRWLRERPGLALVGLGQLLNTATFKTIGAKGVYYGSQLGYEVPWASAFPYNIGISDPQYWGVICSVWGFYLCLAPYADLSKEHFLIPWLETFWYVTSMKLLEHQGNGGWVLKMLGLKAK